MLSHKTIAETMDSSKRGMNPVAMIVINPRKEYWPSRESNQQTAVLKSCTVPTMLWGSAVFTLMLKPQPAGCHYYIHNYRIKRIHLSARSYQVKIGEGKWIILLWLSDECQLAGGQLRILKFFRPWIYNKSNNVIIISFIINNTVIILSS